MQTLEQKQIAPVADEVSAIMAVVSPILTGLVHSLKRDVVDEVGGIELLKLKMLPRVYRSGNGDAGICFEYAVHDAITRAESSVVERIADALRLAKINSTDQRSILFGAEKAGSFQLIDTAQDLITEQSRLMTGKQGRPPHLRRHIASAATAFRTRGNKSSLPQSIDGLWKADLFVGSAEKEGWLGASVKINPKHLTAARGLRLGIVPISEGRTDKVRVEESKNLILCPLPYDGEFVEIFYKAWEVVRTFLRADAKVPKEVELPRPASRQVARYLEERREFPVLDVVNAIDGMAQPELIATEASSAGLVAQGKQHAEPTLTALLAPTPTGLG